MNPEIKNLWIEELRSDRHEQTTGILCDRDGRKCCLGVVTHLAAERGIVSSKKYTSSSGTEAIAYGAIDEFLTLPPEVQLWLGVDVDTPVVPTPDSVDSDEPETSLTELNDVYHWTFEQIADVIEKHL